jgi:hypothetical protein
MDGTVRGIADLKTKFICYSGNNTIASDAHKPGQRLTSLAKQAKVIPWATLVKDKYTKGTIRVGLGTHGSWRHGGTGSRRGLLCH